MDTIVHKFLGEVEVIQWPGIGNLWSAVGVLSSHKPIQIIL